MVAARKRRSWKPTHRVVLVAGESRSVQCVQVMLARDGFAYTRFQWGNVLLPGLRRLAGGRWVLNCHSELAIAGQRTSWRVRTLAPKAAPRRAGV